jgi:hypothetical protein
MQQYTQLQQYTQPINNNYTQYNLKLPTIHTRQILIQHVNWNTGLFDITLGVLTTEPRSLDVTLCDFFLWGYVKYKVHVPPLSASITELKVRIRTSIETVTADYRMWIIVLMLVESQRVHIQSTFKVRNKILECCIKWKDTYTAISSVLCITSCSKTPTIISNNPVKHVQIWTQHVQNNVILSVYNQNLSGYNQILRGYNLILSVYNQKLSGYNQILSGYNLILSGYNNIMSG